MKHPGGNPSTLFCEQVSTVTLLFEKWNDCERAVVMYALLKRLSFPTLKFLQFSIETNLTQNFGSQKNLNSIETNANNPKYLQKLITTYKTFPIVELSQITDKDSILYESDLYLQENEKNYNKKEDILHDILSMLPLLKPGNDEAKGIYLSLIPLAVEDTVRQIVAAELVQQIFSYLLIHPAISNDDRRSLSHWLRHLEDHIQSSFASTGQQSFYILSNPHDTPPESLNTSFSSVNGCNQNSWQAIAPPSHKQQNQVAQQLSNLTMSSQNSASSTSSSDWNLNVLQLPQNYTDERQLTNLNNVSPTQNTLGLIYDKTNQIDNNSVNHQTNEDLHVSFSKNGTEVIDFEETSNDTQIGYNSLLPNIGDHLHPTSYFMDHQMLAIKTRRSNSLTTPISSANKTEKTMNSNCSNSSENLAQFAQKPRSYSLSIESPRNSLTSSESETRLDDLKPNYLKFTTHNIGMSNIGQWLKSLRLHKYIGLFTNMTYEDMLEITEEYLQNLGVTKGASHKLALCIQKLKERFSSLSNMEAELLDNAASPSAVIEQLASIVLTPMKPVDSLSSNNVAGKFLQVLDLVTQVVIQREASTHDEECVNAVLWVLERSLHNEAFVAHTNQLKEQKFKISKLKMQFIPKTHHAKNCGNLSKTRWNSNKPRKMENNPKSGSNDRIQRKNSNDMPNFSLSSLQSQNTTISSSNPSNQQYSQESDKYQSSSAQQQQHLQQYYNTNGVTTTANQQQTVTSQQANSQYKSSSYPNFTSTSGKPSSHQQYRQHRHSLNNLIVLSANPQQQQQVTFKQGKQSPGTLNLNKKPTMGTGNSSENNKTHGPGNITSTKTIVTLDKGTCTATAGGNSTTATTTIPVSLVSSNCNVIAKDENLSMVNDKISSKNSIGDINSSLEFLCLQMTEQAIN